LVLVRSNRVISLEHWVAAEPNPKVLTEQLARPDLRGDDVFGKDARERGLVVLLASLLPRWRDALLLVKPATVLRWHREGFWLFWRWRSRSNKIPISRIDPEVIALIRRMAAENVLWGAERIRGELLKLGIRVAKRSGPTTLVTRWRPDLAAQSVL
jgi:hypothetical protein